MKLILLVACVAYAAAAPQILFESLGIGEDEMPEMPEGEESTADNGQALIVSEVEMSEIPEPRSIDVRSKIGQIKMRFLHPSNDQGLKAILFTPEVIQFWKDAHSLSGQSTISAADWDAMWEKLADYWPNKMGVKIPVTREAWNAVNSNKDDQISIREELIPALFFEKDRFLFDVLFSSLFHRLFDFNQDGKITNAVFKEIDGQRMSEWDFFHNKVNWMGELIQLPPATGAEIQAELDEIKAEQGEEMAEEFAKDLKLVGAIKDVKN